MEASTLYISPLTSKADILGYVDVRGTYHPSPLRSRYENGGRLYIYGYESAHPAVVALLGVLFRAADREQAYTFPDGEAVTAHPEFFPLTVEEGEELARKRRLEQFAVAAETECRTYGKK